MENECTSHDFIVFAIFVPQMISLGENLMKFWQKRFCLVFLGDN